MDTNKVIVTLLVLTIILSLATVAFTAFSANDTVFVNGLRSSDRATVGLYVEGGTPIVGTDNANVGLYVEE